MAEQIFHQMLEEAKVKVLPGRRLVEKTGVRRTGPRVVSIRMENGEEFEGLVFADATYEGDLMAQAGVSYTWGRESSAQYGESLAGVRPTHFQHVFKFPVPAQDAGGRPLPEVQVLR